jgi:ilvC: ketol-acid reductoisomerase
LVGQELVFLRLHTEQRQRQTSLVSRQYFAVVFVHLCRLVSRHFAKLDMIREMLTSSVFTRWNWS